MSNDVIDLLSDDDEAVAVASKSNNAASSSIANIDNTVSLDSSSTAVGNNNMRSSEEDDDDDVILVDDPPKPKQPQKLPPPDAVSKIVNPYAKKRKPNNDTKKVVNKINDKKQKKQNKDGHVAQQRELQSGLVFEEDVDHIQQSRSVVSAGKDSLKQSSLKKKSASMKKGDVDTDSEVEEDQLSNPSSTREYADHQYTTRVLHHLPPILYHDKNFTAGNPGTIDGIHKVSEKSMSKRYDNDSSALSFNPPKCRCRPPILCTLDYSTRDGPNFGRPFHKCCRKTNGCGHFSWAFTSYMIQWYRFGLHNGHALVNSGGFRAEDLVQGKVGDCWFLSALAVVAEREDLISRLIGSNVTNNSNKGKKNKGDDDQLAPNKCGVIEVTLFEDGWWKKFVMDDFLPCFIDQRSEKMENQQLQTALQQSLADAGLVGHAIQTTVVQHTTTTKQKRVSSKFDPNAIPDENYKTLTDVRDFLQSDQYKKNVKFRSSRSDFLSQSLEPLSRKPTISDLAYSKARNNQLWVPFIEKGECVMRWIYQYTTYHFSITNMLMLCLPVSHQ